jgi:hypothetical protein
MFGRLRTSVSELRFTWRTNHHRILSCVALPVDFQPHLLPKGSGSSLPAREWVTTPKRRFNLVRSLFSSNIKVGGVVNEGRLPVHMDGHLTHPRVLSLIGHRAHLRMRRGIHHGTLVQRGKGSPIPYATHRLALSFFHRDGERAGLRALWAGRVLGRKASCCWRAFMM